MLGYYETYKFGEEGKKKMAKTDGAERKPREETQATKDLRTFNTGKKQIEALEARIQTKAQEIADLQVQREQLVASIAEAKSRLMEE